MSDTPGTRKPRERKQLSEFGKAVHHHLIDHGMTLAEMEEAAGLKGANFRRFLVGDAKPPVGWVTNGKLPRFMRVAAAEVHKADIEKLHAAITKLVPDTPTPAQAAA